MTRGARPSDQTRATKNGSAAAGRPVAMLRAERTEARAAELKVLHWSQYALSGPSGFKRHE